MRAFLAIAAAALLTGCASQAPAAVEPAPTVTTTQTVTVTPTSCILALEYADEGFRLAAEGFAATADFDVDTLTEVTAKIRELSPKYGDAKAECEGGQS
jgi:hypothetical protein